MTAEKTINHEEEAKIKNLLLLDLNNDTGSGALLLDTIANKQDHDR